MTQEEVQHTIESSQAMLNAIVALYHSSQTDPEMKEEIYKFLVRNPLKQLVVNMEFLGSGLLAEISKETAECETEEPVNLALLED